jgi:hypothetical protein
VDTAGLAALVRQRAKKSPNLCLGSKNLENLAMIDKFMQRSAVQFRL